ncbi:MAG TPA: sulfurtransferase [Spirochaetia bacterium]|nr:sulfurtransferase [Spirochaetia bacterium]
MFGSLITSSELREHLGETGWVVVDCSFDLDDPEAGRERYAKQHIPGAVYAHLDNDLSAPPALESGRHPLPGPEAMKGTFERMGISNGSQVVVYDATQGMYACRLWWMLRYARHEAVAVLDGGFTEWLRLGGETARGMEENPAGIFELRLRSQWLVHKHQVLGAGTLVDARDGTRYRGEIERRDPRAGHIPGALNYPWRSNLAENGCFLPPDTIKGQLAEVLQGIDPKDAVFYCGSGVTACVDIFAVNLAGFGPPRVYAGSWSEWSIDSSLPIATGAD